MKLTEKQAYRAMFEFLELYYNKTYSDDLGGFLGDMQLKKSGGTMDPAAWLDWIDSVKKITGKISIVELTNEEAYKAMIHFLDRYRKEINSKDVGDLLVAMELTGDDKITKDPEVWQNWIRSIEKVLSEEFD